MSTIENIEVVKGINNINNPKKIDSLYIKDYFTFRNTEYNFDEEDEFEDTWKYEEMLPALLEENTNRYVLKSFVHTNSLIENSSYELIYECNNKNIFFF